jgi:hypothetical protein
MVYDKTGGAMSEINWDVFVKDVESNRLKKKISLRHLSEIIDVHYSGISRMLNGSGCSVHMFISLCQWMGKDPRGYLSAPNDDGERVHRREQGYQRHRE